LEKILFNLKQKNGRYGSYKYKNKEANLINKLKMNTINKMMIDEL